MFSVLFKLIFHVKSGFPKVLIATEGRPAQRDAVLRGNAERLLAGSAPC